MQSVLEKDLVMNVYRDGHWGAFRHQLVTAGNIFFYYYPIAPLYSIIICIIQYVYYYVLLPVCRWDSVSVSEIVRTLYGKASKSCSGASPPLHQCPL